MDTGAEEEPIDQGGRSDLISSLIVVLRRRNKNAWRGIRHEFSLFGVPALMCDVLLTGLLDPT